MVNIDVAFYFIFNIKAPGAKMELLIVSVLMLRSCCQSAGQSF